MIHLMVREIEYPHEGKFYYLSASQGGVMFTGRLDIIACLLGIDYTELFNQLDDAGLLRLNEVGDTFYIVSKDKSVIEDLKDRYSLAMALGGEQ